MKIVDYSNIRAAEEVRQTTDTILMVRPAHFGFNAETAESNAFQKWDTILSQKEISQKAIAEFDAFVAELRVNKINVIVAQDSATPIKPDAVFPNNWISFHQNGTVILYPMQAVSRRKERQESVVAKATQNYKVNRRVDMSSFENQNRFLEGTGSMILDRVNRLVYACLSPRTDPILLNQFCHWADYKKIEFRALDANKTPIYHTNVMMAIGSSFVVICMDSVVYADDRRKLLKRFAATDKEVINISLKQMNAFAGNMLQVHNSEGEEFLVMSTQAYESLTDKQIRVLGEHTNILHSPLYTIESYGGGSARCMMAEIFLPK